MNKPVPPPGVTFADNPALPPPPPSVQFIDSAPTAAEPPPPPGVQWADTAAPQPVAFGSLGRGAIELKSGLRAGAYMLGATSPEDFAKGMAEDEANLLKYPKTQEQTALEQAIPTEGLGALLSHVSAVPSMLGEGIPSMIAMLPAAIGGGLAGSVGGPVGSFAGTAAGVGLGAGAIEYGSAFKDYLRQQGVDVTNPQMSLLALQNKDLVNQAHWYAAKKAGVSGAFNAAGAAVGGKLAARFFTPETKLLSVEAAKGVGAIGGVAAGTQAATEIGQSVAVDEPLNPHQVMVDSFLAGLTNLIPMAAPGLPLMREMKGKRVKTEKDITGTTTLVDEQGRPIVPLHPGEVVPEDHVPPQPFAGLDLAQLERMKEIVQKGPEAASPHEWNKHIADKIAEPIAGVPKTSAPPTIQQADVIPTVAYATDAPISKPDMIRNIEERQLVVEESAPSVRQESGDPGVGSIGPTTPIIDRTLTVSKETPDFVPAPGQPSDIESPVVSSTRGRLDPVARIEVSEQADTQGRNILVVEKVDKPENVPTQSDWGELIVQRVGRYAAENGFDAIRWPKGEDEAGGVKTHVPVAGSAEEPVVTGDEVAPVRRIAQQRQAERITVNLANQRGTRQRLDVLKTAAFADDLSRVPPVTGPVRVHDVVATSIQADPNMKGLLAATQLAIKAFREILPKFNFSKPIQILIMKGMSTSFGDYTDTPTSHIIRLHMDSHSVSGMLGPGDPAASVYTTLWHEFGHALAMDKWGSTAHSTQQLFMDAWKRVMIDPLKNRALTQGQSELNRRSFPKVMQLDLPESKPNLMVPGQITPKMFHYITSFAEFFAEQVAKWATTSEKPRTVLEKWFSALGKKLEELFKLFKTKFPHLTGEAVPEIQTWLDSFVRDISPQFNVGWYGQASRSWTQNARALIAGGMGSVTPTPQTPMTTYMRNMLSSVFGGYMLPSAQAGAALADKFGIFYKYMLSMPQVAERNKHIWGLQRYNEAVHAMHVFRQSMMDPAAATVKMWYGIKRKNMQILNALIEEYSDMSYRTPAEIARGVKRMPTQAEMTAMVQRLHVTPEVLGVFRKVTGDLSFMLDQYADNLRSAAMTNLSDPAAQAMALQKIANEIQRMKEVPYFPWMRFGNYTLTVRDGANRVVHFETFDTIRQRDRAGELAKNQFPQQGPNAFQIYKGELPDEVKPLLGMPPGLLDRINDTLILSPGQKKAMEELRFELAPGQSFKHRFQMKKRTSGYSEDFIRSYANYMFHGSSYIARTKYIDAMERFIQHTRFESEYMPDGTKRSEIASFMSQHLEQIIDAKSDFVKLKATIFHFALGFNPAAAALNLSQQLTATLPFVMAHFGDVRGMASLIGAQTRWKTYWKEGSYQRLAQTDFFSRAMAEGIKGGVLTEAMSPMLAGISEGRTLGRFLGRGASEKLWYNFSKTSSLMFQMTEQMNRRVTFSSVLDLALRDPANKYVRETVGKNQIEYTRLRGDGWTHQEASAYLAATDAVKATQYEYASFARPRIFQGKTGALLTFKSFQLNTLFMLWNYPSTAVRSLLIMGFLGGMMGIPGTEDLGDILKTLAYQIFGKDFDLEREARQFVKDMSDGTVDPGIMLHGIARQGYGIPAVMDMLGEWTGMGDVPMPVVDRSRNIGLGPILPVPLSPFLGPVADPNQAIAQTAQRAAGAAFGVGFNIYKSLVDPQLSWYDMKRWERMMPTALKNVSKMYRVYNEGMDRSGSGAPIITFDPNDTEQMAEIMAMGIGYSPHREVEKQEEMRIAGDAKAFYSLRHDMLLRQLGNAFVMGDKEETQNVLDAIRSFNVSLSKDLKVFAIQRDAIQQSLVSRMKNFKVLKSGRAVDKESTAIIRSLSPLFPEVETNRKVVH